MLKSPRCRPVWQLFISLLLFELTTCLATPVVIAGAGPASLVFAKQHLRNNPDAVIHIYERRPRPPRYSEDDQAISGDFAFGFGFTTRGLLALEKVDWKDSMMAISRPSMSGNFMINRRDMVAEMIHNLEQDFDPSRLKLHFECQVTQLHKNGTLEVQNCRDTSCQQINDYSLLVAADGINSCIRKNLVEMGEIKERRYLNSLSWKALQLGRQKRMPPTGFAPYYAGDELCFVTPRYKDRLVLIFYRFNREDPTAQVNPMNANSTAELKDAILQMFPNVTNLPSDDVLETFLEKLPGQESYMALNRHAVPSKKVALIGDAAVGTYVLFGHGCVSAMERATVLADCLAENPTSLDKALKDFSTQSVKEGHAISDLNLISHILRSKKFLREHALKVRTKIQKYLVDTPELSYSDILKQPDIKWTLRLSKLFWRFKRKKLGR